jgi:hypothetical protein
VVDADSAPLLDEVEPGRALLLDAVLGAEDPGEFLGGDDGHHAEVPLPLSALEVGPDVVELAVVAAGAVGLLEVPAPLPLKPPVCP